jgi:hypothetical protein
VNVALQRLIAIERSQLGVKEKPAGSNTVKYNTAYYKRKVADKGDAHYYWCAVFQWWCFRTAGIPASIFPKTARVFTLMDWYKKAGRFSRTPAVGSLAIFSFSHIGLVVKVSRDGKVVHTIEGNTDGIGSPTGGMVMLKTRSRQILGYCHPDYARAARLIAKAQAPAPKQAAPKQAVPRQAVPTKTTPAGGSSPMSAPATSPATASVAAKQSVAVRPAPAHTAVQATSVAIPAGRVTVVQFSSATANTGRFWSAPVGAKRGYNLATGGGIFIAEVTVESPGMPADAVMEFRLIEVDPSEQYRTVRLHPPGEVAGAGPSTQHLTTLSSIGPGHHLWLRVTSSQPVVLPSVSAEVVVLGS